MHELSMCESIANTVREHASGRDVRRVYVSVGHLRQVVPESLESCWKLAVAGSSLDGSELVVDHVPAAVSCRDCGATSTLSQPILQCDSCGGVNIVFTSGEEFIVESIDLAPAEGKGS